MKFVAAIVLALSICSPAAAKAVKVIQPIVSGVVGANHIVETRVSLNEATKANFDKLEAKAAAKREEAGLKPVEAATTSSERPKPDQYATLPIAQMFPLVVDDQARDWGLSSGRAIRLVVTFDTLKTADAGMAMFLGSSDQLAGLVDIEDAETGEKLGSLYIDVLNTRSGLLGLALRGSGVREKLAFEFSKRLVQQLTGSKNKPRKS